MRNHFWFVVIARLVYLSVVQCVPIAATDSNSTAANETSIRSTFDYPGNGGANPVGNPGYGSSYAPPSNNFGYQQQSPALPGYQQQSPGYGNYGNRYPYGINSNGFTPVNNNQFGNPGNGYTPLNSPNGFNFNPNNYGGYQGSQPLWNGNLGTGQGNNYYRPALPVNYAPGQSNYGGVQPGYGVGQQNYYPGQVNYGAGQPNNYGTGTPTYGVPNYGNGLQNGAPLNNLAGGPRYIPNYGTGNPNYNNPATQNYGSGQPNYGSGPQNYGSGQPNYGSGPQNYGNGQQNYNPGPGSQNQNYGISKQNIPIQPQNNNGQTIGAGLPQPQSVRGQDNNNNNLNPAGPSNSQGNPTNENERSKSQGPVGPPLTPTNTEPLNAPSARPALQSQDFRIGLFEKAASPTEDDTSIESDDEDDEALKAHLSNTNNEKNASPTPEPHASSSDNDV